MSFLDYRSKSSSNKRHERNFLNNHEETISHFNAPNSYPHSGGARPELQEPPSCSVERNDPSFASHLCHTRNVSNFVAKQMSHCNPQRSVEDNRREFLQGSDQLRQKRIDERKRILQEPCKPGPQYDFGGVSYLPVKASARPYRNTSLAAQSTWNAGDVKQALLEWCRNRVSGYKNVKIENFSSSWADGLAFCALIHCFFPDAFDFNSLTPQNRRKNFSTAFSTAERLANIPSILDVEDMVVMPIPDWKSVFTYLQIFYSTFKDFRNY